MQSNKKEESINSLCKKYFTPNLSDEPITESKASLKGKIYGQLLKYADWICNTSFAKIDIDLICGKILDVVELCWKTWEDTPIERIYTNYFYTALKNEILRFLNNRDEKINSYSLSLDAPLDNKNNCTLLDFVEEKKENIDFKLEQKEALKSAENYLRIVDSWFKIKKRNEWYKTLITGELYHALHNYFDYYPNRNLNKFSFIDINIYNKAKCPSKREIAKLLGKDEGQMTRARKHFREEVEILYKKEDYK